MIPVRVQTTLGGPSARATNIGPSESRSNSRKGRLGSISQQMSRVVRHTRSMMSPNGTQKKVMSRESGDDVVDAAVVGAVVPTAHRVKMIVPRNLLRNSPTAQESLAARATPGDRESGAGPLVLAETTAAKLMILRTTSMAGWRKSSSMTTPTTRK
jgi:hypothetical protein